MSDNYRRSTWRVSDDGTNAIALAIQPGVAGQSHYVTFISFAYSGAATNLQARLFDAGANPTEIGRWYISNPNPSTFYFGEKGIKITTGAEVSADLAAAGVGIIGFVVLAGYTAD